jgi:beta-glucosidase/6-phospho-beta-glucosidase/beta-galactosidase
MTPEGFAWATGIEDTFIAQTERIGERVLDEYALTNHYLYWREDIDMAAALGVRAMRYGIPWYKVEPVPGVFQWEWVDRVLEYAAGKGIAIIADLIHYGTPLWLDNQFLNSSYPQRVANFAFEFASRYRHLLSHYTPLNEPLVTVYFCGERGIWPPYLRGDDGAVKLLRSVAQGMALTVQAIRQADRRAVIVSVDAAGESLPVGTAPDLEHAASLRTARTFIATDLITGRVQDGHPLMGWLLAHGMSESDLSWFAGQAVHVDIVGVNYYPESSVHQMQQAGEVYVQKGVWGGADGLYRALRAFATRYGRPVMVTETSTNGSIQQRSQWLNDSIAVVARLRAEGVPVVGYTWWPLFDLIDWSYRAGARPIEEFMARLGPPVLDAQHIARMLEAMRWNRLEQLPLEAYLAPMGLYSLEMQFDGTFRRVATPLVEQYASCIRTGPDAPDTPSRAN